jgi:SAM-dependent methyltransferase
MKPSEVEYANMKAHDEHVKYWLTHQGSKITEKRMKLREYDYFSAFQKLYQHLSVFSGFSILDVGCGAGSEMDVYFLQKKAKIIGVDISREMIRCLHKKTLEEKLWVDCYGIVASARALPFKPESFQVAMTVQALHHCPEPQKVLREMTRVARQVAVYEPNKTSFFHRSFRFISKKLHRKFSVTAFDDALVEFNDVGFDHVEIVSLLGQTGYACSLGIVPNRVPLPRSLTNALILTEGLIQKVPIIKWQMGALLVLSMNH